MSESYNDFMRNARQLAESKYPDEEADPKGFEKWWNFDSEFTDRLDYMVQRKEIRKPSSVMLKKILKYEDAVASVNNKEGFYGAYEDRRMRGTITFESSEMGNFVFDDAGHVQRDASKAMNKEWLFLASYLEQKSMRLVKSQPWYTKLSDAQTAGIETAIKMESKYNPRAQMRWAKGFEIVQCSWDNRNKVAILESESGGKYLIDIAGRIAQYAYLMGQDRLTTQ